MGELEAGAKTSCFQVDSAPIEPHQGSNPPIKHRHFYNLTS